MSSLKLSLLFYDIPSSSKFPNPSYRLRRRALRFNLSCWLVDRDRTPWKLLNEMSAEPGISWHLFELPETEKALQIAAVEMARDLQEIRKREEESIDRAEAALAAVESDTTAGPKTLDAARDKYRKQRESICKRTEKAVADLQEAASMFGLDVAQLNFAETRNRVNALRAINRGKGEVYNALVKQAEGTRLEAAANSDEGVPLGILSDFLADEKDADNSATLKTLTGDNARDDGAKGVDSSALRNGAHITPPSNGHSNGTHVPRVYSAGGRSVTSDLTDREAEALIRHLPGGMVHNVCSRVRQGRVISGVQRAWLHVLAIEEQRARETPAPTSPPPVTQPEAPKPAQPAPTTPALPTVESTKLAYNAETKIFACDASDFTPKLDGFPPEVCVKNVKKGTTGKLTREATYKDAEGETLYVEYTCEVAGKGMTLRVFND